MLRGMLTAACAVEWRGFVWAMLTWEQQVRPAARIRPKQTSEPNRNRIPRDCGSSLESTRSFVDTRTRVSGHVREAPPAAPAPLRRFSSPFPRGAGRLLPCGSGLLLAAPCGASGPFRALGPSLPSGAVGAWGPERRTSPACLTRVSAGKYRKRERGRAVRGRTLAIQIGNQMGASEQMVMNHLDGRACSGARGQRERQCG